MWACGGFLSSLVHQAGAIRDGCGEVDRQPKRLRAPMPSFTAVGCFSGRLRGSGSWTHRSECPSRSVNKKIAAVMGR
ncbi:hypothetical protein B0T18DRAFT_411218 [Schizothecium vesticola]|uniref:Secreted protein n=1 Tax=Schizothecium vesticola TaxID=314040 RepID=A0AA40EVX7_9PEZI|nr:hypothetical protein B0T18DRAFT_411218 [Schizothecium vesticola]